MSQHLFKRTHAAIAGCAALLVLLVGPAAAQFPACRPDMVRAGSFCIDKYEASVWSVPDPTTTNKGLVRRIRLGTADLNDLLDAGAEQVSSNFYQCADTGQDCRNAIFAVSLFDSFPNVSITWFQAQQACANSLKRLPTSAEWQQAVAGTPDHPASSACAPNSSDFTVPTGSRTGCVSSVGAYDMVGNVDEWVADWLPASTAMPGWGGFSGDFMGLAGASTTSTAPGAMTRGGADYHPGGNGPLAVSALYSPSESGLDLLGFRCAR